MAGEKKTKTFETISSRGEWKNNKIQFSDLRKVREGKGIIIPLDRYVTIISAELLGIEATAQLEIRECIYDAAILTVSLNMTTDSNLTLECHNTPNGISKEHAVALPWISGQRNQGQQDHR